jgi:geranylgeranyl pyrophosphate synthase
MINTFKPYNQTNVVDFYKELVKRWADDQLDQLHDYPITRRKQALEELIDSSLEVFRSDILDEIKSRKLSYLS